ncbi:uncharacterized protein LOC134254742 [Saccostrea cucullata]|uniref:uncharacterized protein LOC134254742 n=1 Tax=Saccostrea cuccullata TaxID=36930 RepID=UPI002ED3198B
MATVVIKGALLWITVMMISWTNVTNGQILQDIRAKCTGTNELDFLKKEIIALQKVVKEQAIKMQIQEEQIYSINQKLSLNGDQTSTALLTTGKVATNSKTKFNNTTKTIMTVTTSKTTLSVGTSPIARTSTGIKGKEFLVLFMRNYASASGPFRMFITTNSDSSVAISTSPNLEATIKKATDRIINITSSSNISLPFKLSCDYFKIEPKAVLVETSQLSTISIFASYHVYSNDGTLVIPTNRLSTKYLVSSTDPRSTKPDYYSQFSIAALHEGTNVNIKFRIKATSSIALLGGTYKNQDVFTTTLDKYETFQIGHGSDLSGTFIVSTKPIAVFSGNRYQYLKGGSYSHMVTQLPPLTEFDTQYIVPTFYNNLATLIQVVSTSPSLINISIGSNVSTLHIAEHEYKNFEIDSGEVTILTCENPILIVGFGMGSSNFNYSPYMTVIPGIHQYLDYYKVFVPDGYTHNYICVMILQKYINDIQVNDYSTDNYIFVSRRQVVISQSTFSILTFTVNSGTVVLSTTNNAKFGLIVYGHRNSDGYAFAGNFVLS